MGRPVNKRHFGHGTGNQIKVTFKTGGTEYDGWIVKQTGSKRYQVTDGTHSATCYLVNKSVGGLDNGDMIVNVLTDAGVYQQATKLYNRVAIVEGDTKVAWNYAADQADGAVRITDADASLAQLTITLDTDLVQQLGVTEPDPITYTIVASGVGDLAYQWQLDVGTTGTWTNITGATSASYTIDPTANATDNGNSLRVVVSSASGAAASVTSAEVSIDVLPAP